MRVLPKRRLAVAATAMTLAFVSSVAVTSVTATPAYADDQCATPGMAYLIYGGRLYMSGYNGDQRFGVATVQMPVNAIVEVGANGINPNHVMQFELINRSTGQPWPWVYLPQAGGNCVVNQRSFFIAFPPTGNPNLPPPPPGSYTLTASYQAGNSLPNDPFDLRIVEDEPVVHIDLLPAPPSGGGDGGGGGGGGCLSLPSTALHDAPSTHLLPPC